MQILFLIGRLMYAALFVESGIGHVTKTKQMGAYARSNGVPAAEFMTFLTGVMLLVGAASFIFDVMIFYGALLILLFLVPTAFMMHAFWKVSDPGMKQMQHIQFMKNISLAGAALMIMFFTYGLH
jgi:uncharacterized membrane protein YphA (DoxX/SURF4 family)